MNQLGSSTNFNQNDFDRLQLIRSNNIGPVSYTQLLRRFGTAQSALKAIPELAKRGGGRAPKIADPEQIELELAAIKRFGANLLFLGDENYPRLLAELSNAPPVLIWRGDLSLLENQMIAIVGARNASAAACRFSRDIANSLTNSGASIVSGLARGIDTAAHQGSLNKATIAVIAGGIDIFYPPENEALQKQIAETGLLLCEQPPGTEPRARHFPYRNRIIAGLAQGTLVVEAAPRSGSLITARLAAEAGRHVMAIPGSPLDPRSRGCNNLIREGATLVQSADDIFELLDHFDDRMCEPKNEYLADVPVEEDNDPRTDDSDQVTQQQRQRIFELLSITPVSIDELIRQAEISSASLQLILLELELADKITRHAGARISLKN